MRVCFGTLCFSSRLNAADEEAPQVLGSGRPSDAIHQNHVSKMASIEELQAQLAQKEERIQELVQQLEKIDREILREQRIQELQRSLQQRDLEIINLRSQLDKFQSVFVVCNPASPKHGLNNKLGLRPRKQRAGISAEPQSEATVLDKNKSFPTIYKNERQRIHQLVCAKRHILQINASELQILKTTPTPLNGKDISTTLDEDAKI